MSKIVDICASIALLSIAISMATVTWWVTKEDTSAAKAPACVVMGDGRGQKKER